MTRNGWPYEEAAARAERAYKNYKVSASKYASVRWRRWYNETPDKDPTGTWIQWRKQEIDKLEASLTGKELNYDFDIHRLTPRRISAKHYAARKTLAMQIREHAIKLQVLCDFFQCDLPEEMIDKGDVIVPSVANTPNFANDGNVLSAGVKRM